MVPFVIPGLCGRTLPPFFARMDQYCTRAPRPILCLLALLTVLSLTGQRTVVAEDFPDGKPKLYREEVNGLAEGLWLEWYANGELRYRASWKEGMGYGLWEYFYENGSLRSRSVYVADQPTGIYREYHPNGQVEVETVYVEGRKHGLEITYSPDGTELARKSWREGVRVVDWPEKFAPGVISTAADNEWDLTFMPDGRTLYFTRRPVGEQGQKIYRSELVDGGWSEAKIAAFSTAVDEGPFISPDGIRLVFASFRPIPGRPSEGKYDMNLWTTDMRNGRWTTPEPLPAPVNRVMAADNAWPFAYEAGPFLSADGALYYWTALTAGENADLVKSEPDGPRSWTAPDVVAGLSTEGTESSPVISPDGSLFCFSGYGREDGFGQEDIYCARKTDEGWGKAVNLGPEINTTGNQITPRFSPDGRYFYFASELTNSGQSDIYYLEAEYVPFPRE